MTGSTVVSVEGVDVVVGSPRWDRIWERDPGAIRRALTPAQRQDPALKPLHIFAGMGLRRPTPSPFLS